MENLLVALIVLAATLYLGWHFRRARAKRRAGLAGCGTSCEGCACEQRSSACCGAGSPPGRTSGDGSQIALVALLALAVPGAAQATDTLETFEPGAFDLELYAGYDGLGAARKESTLFGDLYVGYGLAERLSAFAGLLWSADGRLASSEPDLYTGLYGTPVDTERFDLDLCLSLDAVGARFEQLALTPALELNLDLPSPLGGWGVFLRAGVPVAVRGEAPDDPAWQLEFSPGVYLTLAHGHQVLLDYSTAASPRTGARQAVLESGAVSLGYNVALHPGLELINQLTLLLPGGGRPASAGVMVGVITAPGALL